MEHDRLPGAPVFVIDLRAILGGEYAGAHVIAPEVGAASAAPGVIRRRRRWIGCRDDHTLFPEPRLLDHGAARYARRPRLLGKKWRSTSRADAPNGHRDGYRLRRVADFEVATAANLLAASRFPTVRNAAIFVSCSLRGVVVPASHA